MIKRLFSFALAVCACSLGAQAQVRITCIGASITEGYGTSQGHATSYVGQMAGMLGSDYSVFNYGASGRTMIRRGEMPYWDCDQFKLAKASRPNIVFIDLGGNDAKGVHMPAVMTDFVNDAVDMIKTFQNLRTKPRVIILTAIPGFSESYSDIYDPSIVNYVNPFIVEAARQRGIEVLDMHPVIADHADLVPDLIHPNDEGARMMAQKMYDYLMKYPEKPSDGMTFDGLPDNSFTTHVVPGRLEMEDFDTAGYSWAQGASGSNTAYRTEPVAVSTDGPRTYLSHATTGDYVTYTIDVVRSQELQVLLTCATTDAEAAVSITMDGEPLATATTVPATATQQFNQLDLGTHHFAVGRHFLRVELQGAADLDMMSIAEPRQPFVYVGTPYRQLTVPGTIEVEDFDTGEDAFRWQNLQGYDATYRPDKVSISRGGTGYIVEFTSGGDFLSFTFDCTASAYYDIDVYYATAQPVGTCRLAIDGEVLTDQLMQMPTTGNWGVYQPYRMPPVYITEGRHVLQLFPGGDSNFDKLVFTPTPVDAIRPTASGAKRPAQAYTLQGIRATASQTSHRSTGAVLIANETKQIVKP